jgi:hypothetical protein
MISRTRESVRFLRRGEKALDARFTLTADDRVRLALRQTSADGLAGRWMSDPVGPRRPADGTCVPRVLRIACAAQSLFIQRSVPVAQSIRRRPDMKLFLDDYRPAPCGWIPVRTPTDFQYLVSSFDWDVISFDHDLSAQHTEVTGEELLHWMFREGHLPRQKPRVHSTHTATPRLQRFIDSRWRETTGRGARR